MRSVLVTGGAGFIGSNFVRHLLAAEPETRIVTLDALTYAGVRENLDGLEIEGAGERHAFVEGDIADRRLVARLLRERRIDTIVHFAAETHVDRSISGAELFFRTNVMGTLALLEEARLYWVEEKGRGRAPGLPERVRFHHISTDEVFGALAPGEPAWTEAAPYAPNSPYAASKAAADHLVRAYGRTYGLPFTITNCSNNYGPRQYPEKLVPLVILNALGGKELPVYGDGRQVRDWLYVEDHCEAIRKVLREGRSGETYNVGASEARGEGGEITNLELVKKICAILDEERPLTKRGPGAESSVAAIAEEERKERRASAKAWSAAGEIAGPEEKVGMQIAAAAEAAAVEAAGGGDAERKGEGTIEARGMARDEAPRPACESLIRFVADRPGHDRRYAIDSGKIRRELGWRPRHSLDEGLRKTVAWYIKQRGQTKRGR